MIANIPTPQRTNNKVQGEFYPLQKQELIALREAKLINNTAFIHLALRYENPFCDRPVEINPKEFALAWNIPESSVYEAIGKLKKLGILLIKKGKVIIEWVKEKISIPVVVTEPCGSVDLSQEQDSPPPETLRDPRNSEILEKILRSQNNLRDLRKNSEISENQQPEPLPELDSSLSQTLQTNSDLSDQSEKLKDDKNMKDIQNIQDIQEERITIQGNGERGTGNGELGTENGERRTGNSEGVLRENTASDCPFPTPSEEDERLKNEEFIKYSQGKLPKARDIKRYLLTNDKTTGDRILERLWLEYQQWKTGKNNPNSTGNEYFDNLIEEYRKTKPWEEFNWDLVNWDKLPCFDVWLAKAKNCRVDYTFTDDNSLGYTRNLRTLFYRWYEQYYGKQSETTIPENPQALGLINAFRQIMGGGHYA